MIFHFNMKDGYYYDVMPLFGSLFSDEFLVEASSGKEAVKKYCEHEKLQYDFIKLDRKDCNRKYAGKKYYAFSVQPLRIRDGRKEYWYEHEYKKKKMFYRVYAL